MVINSSTLTTSRGAISEHLDSLDCVRRKELREILSDFYDPSGPKQKLKTTQTKNKNFLPPQEEEETVDSGCIP